MGEKNYEELVSSIFLCPYDLDVQLDLWVRGMFSASEVCLIQIKGW